MLKQKSPLSFTQPNMNVEICFLFHRSKIHIYKYLISLKDVLKYRNKEILQFQIKEK